MLSDGPVTDGYVPRHLACSSMQCDQMGVVGGDEQFVFVERTVPVDAGERRRVLHLLATVFPDP